jgi:hypothetical protein
MSHATRNTEVSQCRPWLEPLEDRWCPAVPAAAPPDPATIASNVAITAPVDSNTANSLQFVVNSVIAGLGVLGKDTQVNTAPNPGPPINSPQALVGHVSEFNNLRISLNAGSGGGVTEAEPADVRRPDVDASTAFMAPDAATRMADGALASAEYAILPAADSGGTRLAR